MNIDNVILFAKSLAGEQLTEEESKQLRAHNIRYSLVQFLYMEKIKAEGVDLKDFQFSSGEDFDKTPIIDVVNSLMEVYHKTKNGEYRVFSFGDSSLKNVKYVGNVD